MSERVITTEYTDVKNTPSEIDSTQEAPAYTGVRIFVGTNDSGQEVVYEAGGDTGSVLEIKNPFGTQAMANAVLSDISGYKYQPWSATRALLDPAAELGDGVSTSVVYGGMYRRVTNFGKMMATDIEAPYDAEEQHELGILSPTERHFIRLESQTKASLSITNSNITAEVTRATNAEDALSSRITINATNIEAKVSAEGGNQSFSWNLLSTGFVLKNGNTSIFEANASGITIAGNAVVTGEINATSGYIGNSYNGFQINASSITNGKTSLTDNNNGVYIGTDGIALGANSAFLVTSSGAVTATDLTINGGSINIGNGAFQVDSGGNLSATSGTFEGNVYAQNIEFGGYAGYFAGSGIEPLTIEGGSYGQIGYETISTYNTAGGINTSLGYADYAEEVFSGNIVAEFMTAYEITSSTRMSIGGDFYVGGYSVRWGTVNEGLPVLVKG